MMDLFYFHFISHFYFYFYLFIIFYLGLEVNMMLSLLSLLLPSCMVASVRELANKHFSNSSASISYYSIAQFPPSVAIDIDGDNDIRRRSTLKQCRL